MGLRTKFNLMVLFVFAIGLGASGAVSYRLLQASAREDVLRQARVMIDSALAVRGYTVQQIKPLLEMQLRRAFLPQSVPSYSATETFNKLHDKYPEYSYKEATLNPTNPRDRSTDWEADLINEFRNNPEKTELIGERDTPAGRSLYLAHPIQIKDPACLSCHSTPDQAPATMIKLYGTANGFGWKHNEIVGAQVVSVPTAIPLQQAMTTFQVFMGSLAGIFALLFVVLNLMLGRLVVRPLSRMSQLADQISIGHLDMPELPEKGRDQVAVLARSFNRMRRSLERALKMVEE
jgi:HAMP domain-containing protein